MDFNYNKIKEAFIEKSFPIWQKLGFHITPNHFYHPIPDTRTLEDNLWTKNSELVGIDINEEKMKELLIELSINFKEEYGSFQEDKAKPPKYYLNNGSFGPVDAEIYYSMIRNFKPSKIIEIGSGFSTYLAAEAVLKNEEDFGIDTELTAIEPYPNEYIRKGFQGLTNLITDKVQNIEMSNFLELKKNDILFIDSSHVLKIGSDVQYEFLEILPRLNQGVIVHVHDILLPAEYPKNRILKQHIFWNEQYLLQAFLTFNNTFEILFACSYMHLNYPNLLEDHFSSYNPNINWPDSFWMRKKNEF